MTRALMIALLLAFFVTWSQESLSDRKDDQRRCKEVKLKIRDLEARMRRGYTAAQGIRLEERLRKLKDERYEVCR